MRVSFRELPLYNILFLKGVFTLKFTSKDKNHYFKLFLRQLKINFEVFSLIIE